MNAYFVFLVVLIGLAGGVLCGFMWGVRWAEQRMQTPPHWMAPHEHAPLHDANEPYPRYYE